MFDGVPFQMGITELTPDEDVVLVSVNPAAAAFLGKPANAVQGKRISELGLEGPGAGVWLQQYLQALRDGAPVHFDSPIGLPGNKGCWAVTIAHIGPGPSERPRFFFIAQDVTERKHEERTQDALYRISEAARMEGNLPQLFKTIHEIIGGLLPAKNFFVALHDKGSNQISFPYHVDEFDAPPAVRTMDDGTLSGRVIKLGQSLLFTPETPNEGVYHEDTVVGTPSLDWLGVPLKTKAGTLGALVVQSYDGKVRYLEKDKTLLEFVSVQVAAAIEHRQLTEALSHQAHHDALTGLPNRLLFQDRLRQALELARRNQHLVAVLYMDIDRFKHINDTMGHSAGDTLLRQATRRLQACVRGSDTLARLGGDEFTVVLGELQEPRDAMRVAQKLIECMRPPFSINGREVFVSMSLGISIFPQDAEDAKVLMLNADVAMYRAKDSGRDNFQWYAPEMNVAARERMELETQLRHALTLRELSMAYQPQCDAGGRIIGFEALMRWHHPELGDIAPERFIPLAEDSGLIVPMGEWALQTACLQAAAWRDAGHPHLRMAVNVSAVQFRRSDWVETVQHALQQARLAPEALELEIAESLLMQGSKDIPANLVALRALGVGVALDDFGTGYSCMSYLHRLPISRLKIDQSFVRDIGVAPVDGHAEAAVIRSIISLARNLGLGIIAEGVETEAQRHALLELGCETMQGFLLHRVLSAAEAGCLLQSGTAELA